MDIQAKIVIILFVLLKLKGKQSANIFWRDIVDLVINAGMNILAVEEVIWYKFISM